MKMKKNAMLSMFIMMIAALFVAGCGDDDDTEMTNSQPIIDRVIVPESIKAGETVKLEVVAHDADGDKLTYNWEVSEGTVDAAGVWTVPAEATGATVLVHVGGRCKLSGYKFQNQCRDCCSSRPFKAYCAEGDGVDSRRRVSDGEQRPGGGE